MKTIRVELSEANSFVAKLHRHHKPVVGHRFSIGCEHEGILVGCAIIGRPVARQSDQKHIAEVTRLVTDGTANACSFLYGQAARAAKELGFKSIQTFILQSESGISLKASGWKCEGLTKVGSWQSRDKRRTDQPTEQKIKWSKALCILMICVAMPACGTVAPEVKQSAPVAYTGNALTHATYIAVSKSKGFELSEGQRAEYNALIEIYSHGTVARPLTPPLVKDEGLSLINGQWWQDAQHQVLYRDMRDWRDSGIRASTLD